MIPFLPSTKVFLVRGPTDMRKSFDTLAAIVSQEIQLDPLSGYLFVFCNARRDRLKILFWDRGGFWVCAKRLERGTFSWPDINSDYVELSGVELSLLLSGYEAGEIKRRRWYERAS